MCGKFLTGYERFIGYKIALAAHNIEVNESFIKEGNFKEDSGYDKMVELLNLDEDITAVFVTSSKMTYGAIKAILDKGLQIPKDISVVGFDIHDDSGLMKPSITTILQPERNMGEIAVQLVVDNIKNTEKDFKQKIVLEPTILVKESTDYIINNESVE